VKPRPAPSSRLAKAEAELRKAALAQPESYEEFPWGHRALKVNGKTFAFVVLDEGVLSLSVKLPSSGLFALTLPFAMPTEYGLGRSGWVTARFRPRDRVPLGLLRDWIEESYGAVAPKRLLKSSRKAKPSTAPARRRSR
jgi:predicted DNA-binding protein (MmcQ/YjbR family)